MNPNIIFYAFGATLLVFLSISLFYRQKPGTIQEYYWGGNSLSVRNVASLILSNSFSMNGLLYQVWLGFIIGWWSLAIQAIWCAGFFLLIVKSSKVSDEVSRGTIHFAIERYFGAKAGHIAAIASTLGFAALIGWESVVGATFLKNASQGASGISNSLYLVLPLLLAVVSSFYTRNGGLKGNSAINLIQNGLKIFALVAATGYLIIENPLGVGALTHSPSATIGLSAAAIAIGGGMALFVNALFSFLWQSVDMSVWQSLAGVNTGEDHGAVLRKKRALQWAAVATFIFPGVIGSLIGITLSATSTPISSITDGNILNVFLNSVSQFPVLGALLVGCFAAAMLSTIDGYSLASAQAYTWDIAYKDRVRALLGRTEPYAASYDDGQVIDLGRLVIFFVGVGGAAMMIYLVFGQGVGLFTLVYAVVVGQMSLVGPVLSILFSKYTGEIWQGWLPIASALLAGIACLIVGVWFVPAAFALTPLVTIATSCIVTLGCLAISKRIYREAQKA
jgi:hypothetical protein